jgi:hypothetical protein
MKRNWIRSKSGEARGRWSALYVTMNPEGHIFMTAHTLSKLGDPEAFVMLWDPPNHSIGLEPSTRDEKDAYPALKRCGHGGRVVRAFSYLQEFALTVPETIRFTDPEIDGNVLILDMRKTTSAAKPKRKS